jgi:hypothetical protein
MLTGWDGRMTVLMRKRISRHIEHCGTCGERKRRELSPAMLAAAAPLVAMLPGFREQVLRMCTGNTPAALAHRASVLARSGGFGPSGFPKPAGGTSPWHWLGHHSHAVAAGAATSATAAAVILAVVVGSAPHHGTPYAAPGGGVKPNMGQAIGDPSSSGRAPNGGSGLAPTASAVATVSGPGATTSPGPAATPGVSASPGATATQATGTPSAAASSASPSASPSSSPSAGNGGGEGSLTFSSTTVTLTGGSGNPTGTFTLTATGGPIQHYNITVRSAHYLTVSPASGSLTAGETVTITVTANTTTSFSTWIVVDPGGNKVTIQYGGLNLLCRTIRGSPGRQCLLASIPDRGP